MHVSHTLAHHTRIIWHATLLHNTHAYTRTTHIVTHTHTHTHIACTDRRGRCRQRRDSWLWGAMGRDSVSCWRRGTSSRVTCRYCWNVAHGVINIQTYILMHLGSVWCTHLSTAHLHMHTHALLYLDYFNTNWMVSSCLLRIGCMFRLNW